MAITLADAKLQLNKTTNDDDVELQFYVDAANEWIANEVADDDTFTSKLATRMLVEHWWRTQRGPAGGPLDDSGDGSAGGRDFWRSIPPNVKELLQSRAAEAATPRYSFPDAGGWPDPVAT